MSWILDITVLAIMAITIFLGWKRGFVKTAVVAASGIIALIVAMLLTGPISSALDDIGIGKAFVTLITFVIIYIASKLLLRLLSNILTKLLDIPVLRPMNKALGIVLGVILALIRAWMFCFAVNLVLNIGGFFDMDFAKDIDTGDTILFDLIDNINIFSFLL